MKLLLAYPPFCTPAIVPYSLVNLHAFLKANGVDAGVLDLNVEFHNKKFKEYAEYFKKLKDLSGYDSKVKEYDKVSREFYSMNNKLVIRGENPELFEEMISLIMAEKPDAVGFSIVYSSQAFYVYTLITELNKLGVRTIIGGPAVNEKLASISDVYLRNEFELLEYLKPDLCKPDISKPCIGHSNVECDYPLDYEIFVPDKYFVSEPVVPLKTSHGCYHAGCSFCTHHKGEMYLEYDLKNIEETVKRSKQKYFFIIDDMIPKQRILRLANIMRFYSKEWVCQLRPTKEYDADTFKILKESGCKAITWGVESGCQRILDLMNKCTKVENIKKVLADSHNAGIRNVLYIMFGFPTETREEAELTVEFLENNSENIDLVSVSLFGLQKGSPVYENPGKFDIVEITEEKRTVLPDKITHKAAKGMNPEEVEEFKKSVKHRIEKVNKYPKYLNFFREHMFIF